MPSVKGLRTHPAKPKPAARKQRHTPVMESYPIETARGTNMATKAMVSSLMPNKAPKRENIVMIHIMMRLFTPIALKMRYFSKAEDLFKKV